MDIDFTKMCIKLAYELYMEGDKDEFVEQHLLLMYDSGLMSDYEHVLEIIEEQQAYILLPFITKMLYKKIGKSREDYQ